MTHRVRSEIYDTPTTRNENHVKRWKLTHKGKERCHHSCEKVDKGEIEDYGIKWQRQ